MAPLKSYHQKYEMRFSFLDILTLFFEQYSCQTCHILFLEDMIVKHYLYLSKLAAQMVTSTPSENLSLHLYESQNKNFNFGTLKTLILHARSTFFKGGHPTKIWRKKIFFMKTLSKLGALTVSNYF